MYVCSLSLRRQISNRLLTIVSKRNICYSNQFVSNNITSKKFEQFHNENKMGITLLNQRYNGFTASVFKSRNFSDKKSSPPPPPPDTKRGVTGRDDDDNDEDNSPSDWDDADSDDEWSLSDDDQFPLTVPFTVPDNFPNIPLISSKHPVFPKFMKVFEVRNFN